MTHPIYKEYKEEDKDDEADDTAKESVKRNLAPVCQLHWHAKHVAFPDSRRYTALKFIRHFYSKILNF